MRDNGYTVFFGLDVGKGGHHAVDRDPTGKGLRDTPLPNTEPKLRTPFDKLTAHRQVLVTDQPNTIGTLPVAVARARGLGRVSKALTSGVSAPETWRGLR